MSRRLFLSGALLFCAAASASAQERSVGGELEHLELVATRLSRLVSNQLDEARQDRAVRRIVCLDTTLSEVHSVVRELRHRQRVLQRRPSAPHYEAMARVLRERLHDLRSRAHVCVAGRAQAQHRPGTVVVIEIAGDTPSEEPELRRGSGRTHIPFVPPPASPIL